mmetsp:Transcript_21201/g.46764  ORF Transcript_21201/g.46764 Transcript_21201/m.46764 type:complete len:209 (-) Transcript_21201:162-788(-)
MPPVLKDLRCQILRCAAHRLRRVVILHTLLAQPEISDLGMTVCIEKHVLGLEVTIDDVHGVKVRNAEQDLRAVETTPRLRETTCAAQVVEELSARAKLKHEVELRWRLKGIVQVDDEGMCHSLQDVPLGLRVLNLVPLQDVVFPEHLHGIDGLVLVVPDEHDLAIGTFANDLEQLEIVQGGATRAAGPWCGCRLSCRRRRWGCCCPAA